MSGIFRAVIVYYVIINVIADECNVNVNFNQKIALDDANQKVIIIKSQHTSSPSSCIQECCDNKNCTNVEYILNKRLGNRDEENCLLVTCKDHQCPYRILKGSFIYTLTGRDSETSQKTSPMKATPMVKSPTTSTTVKVPTPISTSEPPHTSTKPTTSIIVMKTGVPTVTVANTLSTTISKSAPGPPHTIDKTSTTTTTSTTVITASKTKEPIETNHKSTTILSITPQSHESTQRTTISPTTVKIVNSGLPPTSKLSTPSEIISLVSIANKKDFDITNSSAKKNIQEMDMEQEPFDLSHGLLISFVVFGLMIVVTTIYVMSSRLKESMRTYRYRNYRKVEYLINDNRWRA